LAELIIVANNTGFSICQLTHIDLYGLTDKKQKLNINEATGCFSSSLLFKDLQ
jgi:hypothetical protein